MLSFNSSSSICPATSKASSSPDPFNIVNKSIRPFWASISCCFFILLKWSYLLAKVDSINIKTGLSALKAADVWANSDNLS